MSDDRFGRIVADILAAARVREALRRVSYEAYGHAMASQLAAIAAARDGRTVAGAAHTLAAAVFAAVGHRALDAAQARAPQPPPPPPPAATWRGPPVNAPGPTGAPN